MKFKLLLILATFFSITASSITSAHGPTPQRVDEKIIVNADIAEAWHLIKSFALIETWHPEVESSEMPDDSSRVLILANGQKITESIDDVDDESHTIGYRLLEENFDAIPVSFYTISIQAETVKEGTQLTWQGRFYRADTGNFPPENLNDEAAVTAMTEFANAGLQGIKDVLEK